MTPKVQADLQPLERVEFFVVQDMALSADPGWLDHKGDAALKSIAPGFWKDVLRRGGSWSGESTWHLPHCPPQTWGQGHMGRGPQCLLHGASGGEWLDLTSANPDLVLDHGICQARNHRKLWMLLDQWGLHNPGPLWGLPNPLPIHMDISLKYPQRYRGWQSKS